MKAGLIGRIGRIKRRALHALRHAHPLIPRIAAYAKAANVSRSSVVIAYYLMLSLFPMLVAMGAVLPYFQIDADVLAPYLGGVVPAPILDALEPYMEGLLGAQNGGLLSISILGALWAASGGLHAIRACIGGASSPNKRLPLAARAASVGALLIILCLLAALPLVFSLTERALSLAAGLFGWGSPAQTAFTALKWPAAFLALFVLSFVIYLLAPNGRACAKNIWAGALVVTVGLLALMWLFTLYVRFFARSLSAYGIMGAVVLLAVWLRALGYFLILGAALNAALCERNDEKEPDSNP